MDLEIDPDLPDAKMITRQQAVIASVLSATVRVTAGRLRGREKDMLGDIIAEMRIQKAKGFH